MMKNEKQPIRKRMRVLRDELSSGEKAEKDQLICLQVLEIIDQRKIKTVHTYLPMGSEVDIYPAIEQMLQKGIKVVTPRSLPGRKLQHLVLQSLEKLEAGIFGTTHPAGSLEYFGTYDLILVPGLAFDLHNNRLGYGAGYYDFFLKNHPEAYKLGICYPFQIVDKLPTEPHDIKLNGLLS